MPSSPHDAAPEPTGRPAPDEPPAAPRPGADGAPAGSSTGSHHPAPLSDLIRRSGTVRRSTGSDVIRALANPGASPISSTPAPKADLPDNIDDAPTVITRHQPLSGQLSPPTPLPVSGDTPSVAGRRLGHFELIEAVGAGGMAAVLRARDLELGRVVALKILPPEAAHDTESVTRFKQEARAAALLDHENVARVYFCGEDQGLHFIAFEFVEGDNLRALLDRRGRLPPAECVGYMIQVAAGLNHAAERGVVHRDIKPSNIIITPDGRAKIVDMGLARHLEGGSVNGGLTQSGVTLGTFDYISPEQALDPRRADVRSDIYSLGCAFYHALTGQPPVPEGTAAKKLDAHQHAEPLDPRELNPAIPDELAAILALMMAKDPDQRYQTPKELIAHLKGLAERMHLGPDVISDSAVQAVQADRPPLPEAPRLRLGWVLVGSAVAVAVAAFLMSTNNPGQPANPPWADDKPHAKGDPVPGAGTSGAPHPATPADGAVRTADELAAKLADPNTTKVQLASGTFDFTKLPEPVVFRGKQLELVGSLGPPTIIRVNPGDCRPLLRAGDERPVPGTLSVGKADSVSISGIRFEVAEPTDEVRPFAAGLTVADAGQVTLTDCVFTVAPGAARRAGVGSVRVARSTDQLTPKVRAERCVFAPANFALWVPDQSELTVFDCGFGPQEVAFRVDDDAPRTFLTVPEAHTRDAAIRLERSSFQLDANSAILGDSSAAAEGPGVRASAGYCVFASAGESVSLPIFPGIANRRPVLVRANDLPAQGLRFEGIAEHRNAYYRVDPLAVTSGETAKYFTFDDCKAAKVPVEDKDAVRLDQRPWGELDPPAALTGPQPWRAFRLRLSDPQVFTPKDSLVRLLGAQFYNDAALPRRRAYPDLSWPPDVPKTPSAEGPRQIVWEPGAAEPTPPGVYSDLAALLKKVQPGDEVLIRYNGVLKLDTTIDLEKPRATSAVAGELRVTFKPDRGFSPILAAPGGERLDQTLFRLINGEVAFEGVQFLLKPARPRDQTVAAVAVVGGRGCSFRGCVFTLCEEDDSRAAAVVVADPSKVMTMESPNRVTPVVRFERCVIRGKGRGVWVPVSRAVEVEVTNTLTAIDGPLFLAEPSGKAVAGARSVLRLSRLTALVGGPVVELKGGRVGEMRASGLVPVEVHSDECLFAGVPGAGQPLVECDGIDPSEVRSVLEWQVRTGNRYANFAPGGAVAVVRPGGDGTNTREWDWNQWVAFAGEPGDKPVGTAMFEKPPPGLRELAAVKPADATVKDVDFPDLAGAKPADAGADVKMLPVPTDNGQEPE